jgi:hypothetical protein
MQKPVGGRSAPNACSLFKGEGVYSPSTVVQQKLGLPKLLFQKLTTLIAGRVKRMEHERYAFILIADEKYWSMLCERNRASSGTFVRKSKVAPKAAQKLLFYVKKPVMQ